MRVLLIINKAYGQDPRAQRAVTALAARGHTVDVISFTDPDYPAPTIPGVRFLRMPIVRRRMGRLTYIFEFALYSVWCFFAGIYLTATRRHDVLQIFTMPEAMSLVCILPKLWGTRIVVDWMDLGYEVYATKFGLRKLDPFPALIRVFEKLIPKVADLVIFPNEGFHAAVAARGVRMKRVAIVLNAADENIFRHARPAEKAGKATKLLFNGSLARYNGWDIAIDAVERLAAARPDISMVMLGEGPDLPQLTERLDYTPAKSSIHYAGRVPLEEMAACISQADVGLIPSRSTPFNNTNLPTRIFEFGTLGTPVVAAALDELRRYFDEDCVVYCEAGNADAFAQSIQELLDDDDRRTRLGENLRRRCGELSWERSREVYLEEMEALV